MIEVPLQVHTEESINESKKREGEPNDQFSVSGRTTLSTSGRSSTSYSGTYNSDEKLSDVTSKMNHRYSNVPIFAKSEQSAIFRTKICLAFVLLAAVVGVSLGAAKLIMDGEQRDFEDQVRLQLVLRLVIYSK